VTPSGEISPIYDARRIDIMASDPAEFENQLIPFLDTYLKGD